VSWSGEKWEVVANMIERVELSGVRVGIVGVGKQGLVSGVNYI
jgi:phosphoglycerate dehydrogenase-like enzyme